MEGKLRDLIHTRDMNNIELALQLCRATMSKDESDELMIHLIDRLMNPVVEFKEGGLRDMTSEGNTSFYEPLTKAKIQEYFTEIYQEEAFKANITKFLKDNFNCIRTYH